MYDLLIDLTIQNFSNPGESEEGFMKRMSLADPKLKSNYTRSNVSCEPYSEGSSRAAYLLRYLGHYTLQLGGLLKALEGNQAVVDVITLPELNVACLCGGPCPEAIAISLLHSQAKGRRLRALCLDKQAKFWEDCWHISEKIATHYGSHPHVSIKGEGTDMLSYEQKEKERNFLKRANILTLMNCLNELIVNGKETGRLESLYNRLKQLQPGALILLSDQSEYTGNQDSLRDFCNFLVQDLGAEIVVCDEKIHWQNRFNSNQPPSRISSIYGHDNNYFRIHQRNLQLAAIVK